MKLYFRFLLRHLIQSAILITWFYVIVTAQCKAPLDEETIQSLFFGTNYSLQVQSGQNLQLQLYKSLAGIVLVPVDACVKWSVHPIGLGSLSFAHLDPQSGLLSIDPQTPSRASYILTANVENGRRILSISVHVYKPEDKLIGAWKETKRFSCKSGKPISVADPIRELVFRADGKMYATRFLFETYFDFEGTYLFNNESQDFAFVIDSANMRPIDVDGFGRFRVDESGGLILHKLSLGRFSEEEKQACTYEFEKTDSRIR